MLLQHAVKDKFAKAEVLSRSPLVVGSEMRLISVEGQSDA